jgi:hypothetical protein
MERWASEEGESPRAGVSGGVGFGVDSSMTTVGKVVCCDGDDSCEVG